MVQYRVLMTGKVHQYPTCTVGRCHSWATCGTYRRRIYTEEKAKVVAAAWGKELIQLLDALAILQQDDLKNRMISS